MCPPYSLSYSVLRAVAAQARCSVTTERTSQDERIMMVNGHHKLLNLFKMKDINIIFISIQFPIANSIYMLHVLFQII